MKKKFKKEKRITLPKECPAGGKIRHPIYKCEPIQQGAPMDIVDVFSFMAFQVLKRDQHEADQL